MADNIQDPDYKDYQDYKYYSDYQTYMKQSSSSAQPQERGFLGRLGYNTLSALPAAGALAAGTMALPSAPATFGIGPVAAAGAGAVAGKSLEQAGKKYFFDEGPESRKEQYSDLGEAAKSGVMQEAGGQIIGKTASLAKDALKSQAGRSAYKSLGPFGRDVKNVPMDEIAKKGQNLRDTGIVRAMPTNYQGLADRAESVLEQKGPQFEQMAKQISEQSGQSIPKEKLIANLQRELSPNPDIPTLKHTSNQIEEMVNQVRAGKPQLSVPEAQNLKSQIGQLLEKRNVWSSLKKGNEISTENQFLVSYYHGLNRAVEDAGDAASEKIGGDIGNQWRQLKQDYGTSREALKIASTKAGKEYVNRFISPSDYISAGAGMISHGNAGGVAIGSANMLGRKFGNQTISNLSAAGANTLGAASKAIEPISKEAIGLLKQKDKGDN